MNKLLEQFKGADMHSTASRKLQLGDWVQAMREIFDEETLAARAGDVGHVISPPDKSGWTNVQFERTGMTCIVHPTEVKFLGDAETGRAPVKTVTHGN